MFSFFKRRRRKKLRDQPLPDAWWQIIDRRVPIVASLSDDDRRELAGHIQVLLAEKRFEGCDGLEITDEIRVTIAAQAAILLLHRDTNYYPTLNTILVYPSAYVSRAPRLNPNGTVSEGQVRLGESWFRGSIVLSWNDVLRGAADDDDGHNLVFHEFAHQLDGEAGDMEGAPKLPSATHYREWARVLGAEYHTLIQSVHDGHKTLLDPYGTTNPAEFFAVATELFFERPHAMQRQYPELYEQLATFYQQHPADPSV